jgi:hypothetical protein
MLDGIETIRSLGLIEIIIVVIKRLERVLEIGGYNE